jgi:hypothetical protein
MTFIVQYSYLVILTIMKGLNTLLVLTFIRIARLVFNNYNVLKWSLTFQNLTPLVFPLIFVNFVYRWLTD